ncbi:MAG: hypothetical protein WBV82_32610, partial [Myxococcaceae bacterium]
MSINWTKRLVVPALITSLSGVGVASAQSWEDRDARDSNRDPYGQLADRNGGEKSEGDRVEFVGYGRDHKRDHGRHHGHKRHGHKRHGRGHGHGHGRDHG